jgi:hypothetical protein
VNGWLTYRCSINRGVRQGDPLSPYVFILCVELLGNAVRKHEGIKGITIQGKDYKINQYADDT